MLGLMQDWPLLCHRIIDHAATHHASRQVINGVLQHPGPRQRERRRCDDAGQAQQEGTAMPGQMYD